MLHSTKGWARLPGAVRSGVVSLSATCSGGALRSGSMPMIRIWIPPLWPLAIRSMHVRKERRHGLAIGEIRKDRGVPA